MLNKGDATQWPMLLDMTKDECRKILRRLELEAYSSVVTVLRAQGSFTTEKKRLLQDLASTLSISTERHRAEVRLAVNSEKLATIAQHIAGPNTGLEWSREGRRVIPLMPRLVPQTAFMPRANLAANMVAANNAQLPQPSQTAKKSEIKKEIDFKYSAVGGSVPHSCPLSSVPITPAFIAPPSKMCIAPNIPPSASNSHSASIAPSSKTFIAHTIPPSSPTSTLNSPSTFIAPPSPSKTFIASATPLSTLNSPSTFIAPPSPTVLPSPSKTFIASNIPPSTLNTPSTFIPPPVPPSLSKTIIAQTIPPSSPASTSPLTLIAPPPPSSKTCVVPTVPSSSSNSAPNIPLSSPTSMSNSPSVCITLSSPTVPSPSSTSNTSSIFLASPPTFTGACLPTSLPNKNLTFVAPSPTSSAPTVLPSPVISLLSTSFTFEASSPLPSSTVSPCPPSSSSSTFPDLVVPSSLTSISSLSPSFIAPTVSVCPSHSTLSSLSTLAPSTTALATSFPVSPPPSVTFVQSRVPPSSSTCTSTNLVASSTSADLPSTFIVSSSSPSAQSLTFKNPSTLVNLVASSADPSPTFIFPVASSCQSSPTSTTPSTSTLLVVSPSSASCMTSVSDLPSPTISFCPTSLVSTITDSPSMSIVSASQQIPVSEIVSVSNNFNSVSTSSFLSSIPLISVPPATSFASPIIATAPALSTEVADLDQPLSALLQPLTTTFIKEAEETYKKVEDTVMDVSTPQPHPTLMLPSGMSIQLREEETDKPKKRKRSLSQDAPVLRKKIMTVPVTKAAVPTPTTGTPAVPMLARATPVKISVNTPVTNRTPCVTSLPPLSSISTKKVIIVSNTSSGSAANPLSIVKTNRNRFQSPQVLGTKLQANMIKCRPRSNSIMIPNIQLKSDDTLSLDSTIKCLTGTPRILPKPSSMLIVNPTPKPLKVPLTSGSTRLEAKPNVVIVHKGSVSKSLNIANTSKVLTSKPTRHTTNPPMPIATTAGNLILLDLSQDRYDHNATIAEILEASGILPSNLALSSAPQTVSSRGVQSRADTANEAEADLSENSISFMTADGQFDPQPVTKQIIIESVPAQVTGEHSQISFLPSLDAPVTIQHSDLDASSLPLEEYTSQQLENQNLS